MTGEASKAPSEDQCDVALKRTRRNVMAMAGIAAGALVASSLAAGKAAASGGKRSFSLWDCDEGVACFLIGTKILTAGGERAVEDLHVGDRLPTASGRMREIKKIASWVVERELDRNWPDDVAPIKVCRSAIAPNFPQRDLYLSPLHALYIDGILIAARKLVNGRSIIRCTDYDAHTLTYFNVELEDHQVIWAEGLPVESRLVGSMAACAPLWDSGRRAELASRFRSAVSPWFDKRDVYDKVRDRLEARSEANLGGYGCAG
ncbi:hypothetical protein HYPDE_26038 [Hyphomicrobium denitrificans 1NES1]|uniref:Hedgehog/Intein (Hint) domain-containing protein n=1 Tax=Hyphomicrobium denitrificans 1NES1 TaxID=670307 RepID=N0B9V1_9HYPH|nr:Hint domain-containing protein [Hyphomicrobium denitrificans]AGK56890.1 hypothetical protein HYPDE_26038 [Hyphomicrobium denitrificans 1NES1]